MVFIVVFVQGQVKVCCSMVYNVYVIVEELDMQICVECFDDIDVIYVFICEVFQDVFYSSYIELFIVDVLCWFGVLLVLLVVEEGVVLLGYVVLLLVELSDGSIDWYGFGLILVLFVQQGCGIGSVLMQVVIDVLQVCGVVGCVLFGDLVYYVCFGFEVDLCLWLFGIFVVYFQLWWFCGDSFDVDVCYYVGFDVIG